MRAAPSCAAAAASAAAAGAEQRRRPRLCPPPLALLLLLLLSLGLLHAGTRRVREGVSPRAECFVPKHSGFRRRSLWAEGRRGGTGEASRTPDMHHSRARSAGSGTHPPTVRRALGAEERPFPLPRFLPPAFPAFARIVDKSPLQQPLIKDLAGGGGRGCAPETNVPDALLLFALVFTESQAGIRFPPPPPPLLREETRSLVLLLWSWGVAARRRNRTTWKDFHQSL